MARLQNKVALITGAARGMGAAHAELFVDQGATVWATDVLDAEGKALAERLGDSCTFRHHDVTAPSDWQTIIDEIMAAEGRIDVLVNNAGIVHLGGIADTSIDEWNRVIDINQTGPFLGMQTVLEPMASGGGGSIVNISSVAGMGAAAGLFAYGASKWALRGMTKSVAKEVGPRNIRVNSVHPGLIDTDMLSALGASKDQLTPLVPLQRVADAAEVSQLVLFLASDDSSYCSGQEFVIDGAMSA